MRLALPVSIPAPCFFDQRAVHDKNSTSFLRPALFVPKHVTLSQKMREDAFSVASQHSVGLVDIK